MVDVPRSLGDMLRAAGVLDNAGAEIKDFKRWDMLFMAIKRAGEVALAQDEAASPTDVARAIMRDAGLMP